MTVEFFRIDTHEPSEAFSLLSPALPRVEIELLNEMGYADYLWGGFDDTLHQAERKQWSELLSDLDSVEDQLRKQMQTHPEVKHMLIVEGIAIQGASGVMVFKPSRKQNILVCKGTYNKGLGLVYPWLYQVSKFTEVFFTSDLTATCVALASFCKSDQKEEHEHRTFHRHLKIVTFHPNLQVQKLMALASGVGEARAVALIQKFGTCWNVINASPEQLQTVEGIGPKVSLKLLREIGRPDV